MTKVTMPDPQLIVDFCENADLHVWEAGNERSAGVVRNASRGEYITTDQAEAYADARVAESQQWISVDDRLPETNRGISGWVRALAYWTTSDPDYEPGGIETSFFDGRNWQGANGDMDYHGARRVTHWMPLPEPPTE